LALWLTIDAIQRGAWWRWGLLFAVTSLSFYTHLLAVLVVPVQVLWLWLVPADRRPVQRARIIGTYLLVLFLPYVPLAAWQARAWLSPPSDTGYPFVPLLQILLVLAVGFSRGVLPVKEPVTLLPAMLGLLAGGGLWATDRMRASRRSAAHARSDVDDTIAAGAQSANEPWRTVALLAIWLLLPPIAIYGISLNRPLFADRYLIWAMPAFLTLVAMGVVALDRSLRPLGGLTLAAFLALCLVGVWSQAYQPYKSDFRSAARFLQEHQRPGDLLVFQIPYNRYTFTYYSSGTFDPGNESYRWVEGPYTNNGMSEDALADLMAHDTAQAQAAWLIASEISLWDKRGLTEGWFATQGNATDRADFTRVSVTRYLLRR
jgi:hypothetical protein